MKLQSSSVLLHFISQILIDYISELHICFDCPLLLPIVPLSIEDRLAIFSLSTVVRKQRLSMYVLVDQVSYSNIVLISCTSSLLFSACFTYKLTVYCLIFSNQSVQFMGANSCFGFSLEYGNRQPSQLEMMNSKLSFPKMEGQ